MSAILVLMWINLLLNTLFFDFPFDGSIFLWQSVFKFFQNSQDQRKGKVGNASLGTRAWGWELGEESMGMGG